MNYVLRDYQEKTKSDVYNFLFKSKNKKGVIIKPVGTGKALDTAIISQLSKEIGDCLVIQPSIELLIQNVEKARHFGLNPTIYSAGMGSKEVSGLTYATPLSVASVPDLFNNVKVVVVDEAHTGMTNNVKGVKLVKSGVFNTFLNKIKPKKIIGLTATPIQLVTTMQGSKLNMVNRSRKSFWNGSEIIHVTQVEDIKDKYWAKLNYIFSDINGTVPLQLNTLGTEFTSKSIIEVYESNSISQQVINNSNYLKHHLLKKKVLTFVPSVEAGIELAKKDPSYGVIHGSLSKLEREKILHEFKNGDLFNLINCEVLTTGFDFPGLDAIIMARETNSFSLYYQMIGRVVRPIIKKDGSIFRKDAYIIDLTDNYVRFGDISDIKFENNPYTGGWGMWSNDKLMTGCLYSDIKLPLRQALIDKHKMEMDLANRKSISEARSSSNKYSDVIFYFGKHNLKTVEFVCKKDPNYIKWMLLKSNFKWIGARNNRIKEAIHHYIDILNLNLED